jgi:hypothetical protein
MYELIPNNSNSFIYPVVPTFIIMINPIYTHCHSFYSLENSIINCPWNSLLFGNIRPSSRSNSGCGTLKGPRFANKLSQLINNHVFRRRRASLLRIFRRTLIFTGQMKLFIMKFTKFITDNSRGTATQINLLFAWESRSIHAINSHLLRSAWWGPLGVLVSICFF